KAAASIHWFLWLFLVSRSQQILRALQKWPVKHSLTFHHFSQPFSYQHSVHHFRRRGNTFRHAFSAGGAPQHLSLASAL
ncbi:MAG: hypothetical protein AB7V55_06880, partial [Oscillospiraceae bacterium]